MINLFWLWMAVNMVVEVFRIEVFASHRGRLSIWEFTKTLLSIYYFLQMVPNLAILSNIWFLTPTPIPGEKIIPCLLLF